MNFAFGIGSASLILFVTYNAKSKAFSPRAENFKPYWTALLPDQEAQGQQRRQSASDTPELMSKEIEQDWEMEQRSESVPLGAVFEVPITPSSEDLEIDQDDLPFKNVLPRKMPR